MNEYEKSIVVGTFIKAWFWCVRPSALFSALFYPLCPASVCEARAPPPTRFPHPVLGELCNTCTLPAVGPGPVPCPTLPPHPRRRHLPDLPLTCLCLRPPRRLRHHPDPSGRRKKDDSTPPWPKCASRGRTADEEEGVQCGGVRLQCEECRTHQCTYFRYTEYIRSRCRFTE